MFFKQKMTLALAGALTLALACATTNPAGAQTDPIKVFILAGQSNMVGHGKTLNGLNPDYNPADPSSQKEIVGGIGSLTWAVDTMPSTYGFGGTNALVDSNGDWLVRGDVNVYSRMEVFEDGAGGLTTGITRQGAHTVGFGKQNSGSQKWNGPEYGFGHMVGNALDEDVLIIKVATGGTSLGEDWFSPTAVTNRGGTAGAGAKAGYTYATEVGYMWTHMLDTVQGVLDNLDGEFSEYAGRDHEIAGFGWHQGYNDVNGGNATWTADYEENLTDFIADVRTVYGSDLPFVIGTTSMFDDSIPDNDVELAQLAVGADDPFTTTIDTSGFWRGEDESPSEFDYHWNHNGITHYEVGAGMGDAMVALVPEPGSLVVLGIGGAMVLARRRKHTA